MKILNVVHLIDNVTGGGFVERTVQMSRALIKNNHDCSILTTNFNLTEKRKKELTPIKLIVLPCMNKRYFIPKFSLRRIREAVQNTDQIHLMGLWSPLNCIVYFYARRYNIPYVLCPAGTLKIYGRSHLLKKLYNLVIGNCILENAKSLIAVSELELEDFENYGFSNDQINVIPNGVSEFGFTDKNTSEFRLKYQIEDSPYILFIGRMNLFKGPDLLLEAFIKLSQQYKNLHLVMAGPDENMCNTLNSLIKGNRLEERIHIISYLGGDEKSQALHGCEFLVIPSRHDAMSIVVLEAGIVSKPVIITEQSGFSVIAAIDGGSVCNADIDSLSHEMNRFLIMDKNLLREKGENLFHFVKEHFIWDVIVKRFIDLYNKS